MARARRAGKTHPKAPDRATLRRAVKGLHKVLRRQPDDLRAMVRMARAYRLLGDADKAARWYTVAIRALSNKGQGLRALALAKERVAVAPDDHASLLEMARLYARHPGAQRDSTGRVAVPVEVKESTVVGRIPREFTATSAKALQILDDPDEVERLHVQAAAVETEPPSAQASRRPPPAPPPAAFATEEREVLKRVEKEAAQPPPASKKQRGGKAALEQARLGEVPLLSGLGKGAFVTLMQEMERVTLEKGQVLFEEGDPARSFFIVAEGEIEAQAERGGQQTVLARLREGEVIGVLGLYSGRKRNATASATRPTVVFEITDKVLNRLVKEHPASKKALSSFYRTRLLETFLGSCPLFKDIPRRQRLDIVAAFRSRRIEKGQRIVSPGEVNNGLFLILRGEIEISSRVGGEAVRKATLRRGQFFGNLAAIIGVPSRFSARSLGDGLVAALSHRAFADMLRRHPDLRGLPGILRREGMMVSPTMFIGETGVPGLRED